MKETLIFLITLAITTSSFANEERDGFYAKGEIGVNKIQKLEKILASECYNDNSIHFTKNKSFNPYFNTEYSAGSGYYINDFLRGDVKLNFININRNKADFNIIDLSTEDRGDEIKVDMDNKLKRNAFVISLLGNIYSDFLITQETNVFLGLGLGISQIKEKIIFNIDSKTYINDIKYEKNNIYYKCNTKPKINFTYSLTVGVSHKITDNAYLELSYSWKDYGKTHPKDEDGERTYHDTRYQGHHVVVGLRFDI